MPVSLAEVEDHFGRNPANIPCAWADCDYWMNPDHSSDLQEAVWGEARESGRILLYCSQECLDQSDYSDPWEPSGQLTLMEVDHAP